MPIDNKYSAIKIRVSDGGRLMSDIAPAVVGLGNYTTKENWRRDGFGDGAREVIREGWDYFRPNGGGSATNQKTVAAGSPILGMHEARRPNGTAVVVAVNAAGGVYWFDYDTSAWISIGSGYSTPPAGRRWQIINVGPYVVFNNAIDLPFTWLIGAVAVVPIYELREQAVASVGSIWEYNQALMLGDILEINSANMSALMNGGTPYAQVTNPATTQRVQYRIQWSNVGDPRDHAATVNSTATATSTTLTLAWPMASFTIGDEITVIGAGTSGGNHVTTIANLVGTTLTMGTPAVTSISNTPVQKTTALNSIVGFYEFEDAGTPVLRGLPLQNRCVIYKSDSIYVGYYTGDLDEPFVFERQYRGSRTPRFRWTLVDVGGLYHLFAGDEHFYRFRLGVQEPEIDPIMSQCEIALFYTAKSGRNENEVFSINNGATNEIWIMSLLGATPLADDVIAYDYAHGTVSVITKTTDATAFSSGCTIHKPLTGDTADQREVWFVMGGIDGLVTTFGKTNLASTTFSRWGSYSATSQFITGLGDFGDSFNEKDVRSWIILTQSARPMSFSLGVASRDNQSVTIAETKTVSNPSTPTLVPLFYRTTYIRETLAATPDSSTSATAGPNFYGRIWEVGKVKSRAISRISS